MTSFRTWLEDTEKIVYIIRGPSGTGKSTISQTIGGQIFSTDDFFGKTPKEYLANFSGEKLPEAHQWNIDRVADAMRNSVSPIIVDNTTIEAWEAKPYVLLADKFGYDVKIQEPQSDVWKDIKDAMGRKDQAALDSAADVLAQRNKHGVPKETIQDMFQRWQGGITPDQIRRSKMPWEE